MTLIGRLNFSLLTDDFISQLKKLKKLLDDNFDLAEWVKAHRYRREQYQLSGSDGELNYKIPKKNFPEEILSAVKKHSI